MKNYALILFLLFGCLALNAQTIHVSPAGNDAWDGSEQKPVATLTKAQELARRLSLDCSVEIVLEDGIYYLPETLILTGEDSRSYPYKLTFRARNAGRGELVFENVIKF